jgi:predicted amidohydrolase YtcJ
LLNTAARVELGLSGGTGLLLDADDLLRERLGGALPSLSALSSRLAGTGVTGVTDAGVNNGPAELAGLRAAHDRGELLQRCLVLGSEALPADPGQEPGPVLAGALKIVLAEHDLPGLDDLAARITAAGDRGVAIHAASLEALALATVALRATGRPGQRVEHASIAPPDLVEALRQVRARVVTQPGFVARHGDRYLRTVPAPDQPWLYRLAGWLAAGVPLAAGSDSPYGPDDPWIAMVTATSRLTADGRALGPGEALTPEQALSLFTSPLSAPGTPPGPLRVGDRGDLCLLRVPWRQARRELSAQLVAATVIGGQVAWSASR